MLIQHSDLTAFRSAFLKLFDHNQNKKYNLRYNSNVLTYIFLYISIKLKYKSHEINLTHIMCVMDCMFVCLQNS